MKIAHCLVDDKFIDSIINSFELTKGIHTNEYIYISFEVKTNYKLIKQTHYIKNILFKDAINYINNGNFDLVILHGWASFPSNKIQFIDKKIKILWKAWGYDIYRSPDEIKPFIKLDCLHPMTYEYWKKECFNQRFINLKVHLYNLIHKREIKKAISRVNYFSGCLPVEYNMIKKSTRYFRAQQLEFDYCDVIDKYEWNVIEDLPILGTNILVGNSASILGNHIDILNKLENCSITKQKIILPLSYGGDDKYINYIKKYNQTHFNSSLYIMENFLPKEEYYRILNTCSFAIFGHERQAALGNIWRAMWNGMKIFLSETSVSYMFFKEKGFLVYSIQKDLDRETIKMELTKDQKLYNREKFLKMYSVEESLTKIRNIYNTILEN